MRKAAVIPDEGCRAIFDFAVEAAIDFELPGRRERGLVDRQLERLCVERDQLSERQRIAGEGFKLRVADVDHAHQLQEVGVGIARALVRAHDLAAKDRSDVGRDIEPSKRGARECAKDGHDRPPDSTAAETRGDDAAAIFESDSLNLDLGPQALAQNEQISVRYIDVQASHATFVRFNGQRRLRRSECLNRPLRSDRGAARLQIDFDMELAAIHQAGELIEHLGLSQGRGGREKNYRRETKHQSAMTRCKLLAG